MKKYLIILSLGSIYGCQTSGPLKCKSVSLKDPGHAVAFYKTSKAEDKNIGGYISAKATISLTGNATKDTQLIKVQKGSSLDGKTVWVEKDSINCQ